MLKNLVAILTALAGDFSLGRFWGSLCAGCGVIFLTYWLLPGALPLWPAIALLSTAFVVGLAWAHWASGKDELPAAWSAWRR